MIDTLVMGPYKLVEKYIAKAEGTICTIYRKGRKLGVYCSIPDALAHSCEWLGDGYFKYAVFIKKFNTSAVVHIVAQDEEDLKKILTTPKYDGWELQSFEVLK